jgi:hypothetical protein
MVLVVSSRISIQFGGNCWTNSHDSGSFLPESLFNLEEIVGQVQGSYMQLQLHFFFLKNLKSTFPNCTSESLFHYTVY